MWNWVILEIAKDDEIYYKVLGQIDLGMNGWRINSGITEVSETETSYNFRGVSGSMYVCPKDAEELSGATDHIYHKLAKSGLANIVKASEIKNEYLLGD